MARRRRKKRNPGGLFGFAHEHPWLTVLFVLPITAGVLHAGIQALRGRDPAPPAPGQLGYKGKSIVVSPGAMAGADLDYVHANS